ncbi:ABC transporter ATP-binding protein [Halanaerobium congolense]|uniref:ABC-type quaternary amine transporter n=1 Tax=Halanaerobium congolense TaxID=54121 RepID=A0A1G6JRT8_9FIRM|nr:ABC transporter ATP-binding protein [Halanaerobium congolense]SDC21371.1 iron(III) transport system ATP-binding protein [Halanaerobium congolense]SDK42705.1 iron(III) transport system ATP-binding protein [Halanaerobium congolense]SDM97715.1 iron(III) transport system ATP-binding protein [Halanaerobium congolense]
MQLEIKNLTFAYNKKEGNIVDNFNLEVKKGEIVALVGASGSGKSTVLRLTAGLEIPDSGKISIAGQTVAGDHKFRAAEKREVGMVFQDYALFPHLSVEKNIAFGIDHLSKDRRKARVKKLLKLVNLEGFEKRYPHQLSGGQQQRIALARTLAPGPKLLLLDEPFSNLDAELKDKIRGELNQIIKEIGVTTILVSHDREDAEFMQAREIIMN